MGKYQLIAADPPWTFATRSAKGKGRSPEQHYATLDFDALCALPVGEAAARDAVLALWVTAPLLLYTRPGDARPALDRLLAAWGFTYSSVGFVWVKTTKRPRPRPVFADGTGLHWGLGYRSRQNAEFLLLANKGAGLPTANKGVHSVVLAPVGAHSAKPPEVHARLEALFGDVPRLEIFGRRLVPGWTVIGDGIDGQDIRVSLPALIVGGVVDG